MSRKVLPFKISFISADALTIHVVIALHLISMNSFGFTHEAKDDKFRPSETQLNEFPRMTLVFDSVEVKAQAGHFAGDKRFEDAVSDALTSIIHDRSDLESPLSLARELCVDDDKSNECARNVLMHFWHKPKSSMALIGRTNQDNRSNCFMPERGEHIEDNWLFCVRLPELSEHLFWAIVPRNRIQAAYNYGYNRHAKLTTSVLMAITPSDSDFS